MSWFEHPDLFIVFTVYIHLVTKGWDPLPEQALLCSFYLINKTNNLLMWVLTLKVLLLNVLAFYSGVEQHFKNDSLFKFLDKYRLRPQADSDLLNCFCADVKFWLNLHMGVSPQSYMIRKLLLSKNTIVRVKEQFEAFSKKFETALKS